MPRSRYPDEYDEQNVHRRRYSRKRSATPILIVAGVGVVILVVILLLASGSKEDPAAKEAQIRDVATQFLAACLKKDRLGAEKLVNPIGGRGWVGSHLRKTGRDKYRSDPVYQKEQDDRMWSEMERFSERMKWASFPEITSAVVRAEPKYEGVFVVLKVQNKRGVLLLTMRATGGSCEVQNWEITENAW